MFAGAASTQAVVAGTSVCHHCARPAINQPVIPGAEMNVARNPHTREDLNGIVAVIRVGNVNTRYTFKGLSNVEHPDRDRLTTVNHWPDSTDGNRLVDFVDSKVAACPVLKTSSVDRQHAAIANLSQYGRWRWVFDDKGANRERVCRRANIRIGEASAAEKTKVNAVFVPEWFWVADTNGDISRGRIVANGQCVQADIDRRKRTNVNSEPNV